MMWKFLIFSTTMVTLLATNECCALGDTAICHEIAKNRVRIDNGNRVFFDGRLVGIIPKEPINRHGGNYPPETLPDGISGYRENDLKNGILFLSGGDKPENGDRPATTSSKTYFWNISKRELHSGPDLECSRAVHTVVRLADNRLLIIGGVSISKATSGEVAEYATLVEVLDPKNAKIAPCGNTLLGRLSPSVLQLDSATLVIAGGQTMAEDGEMETQSIELFDFGKRESQQLGKLCHSRQAGVLLKISNRQLLLIEGYNSKSEKNSRSLNPEIITLPREFGATKRE